MLNRLKAFWLLLEYIGMHPHTPVVSDEFMEMLKKAGWRFFYFERVTRG